MQQHQEWPLDSEKHPNADKELARKHSPLRWCNRNMAWHSLLCVWYPSLGSSWNCGLLLHTAHYLFLKDLMRSCAVDCVLVQLLPGVPHQPAPPNNLLWIREQPSSMARQVAVQRAWLGPHHHLVKRRNRRWSIQAEFQTNQNTALG